MKISGAPSVPRVPTPKFPKPPNVSASIKIAAATKVKAPKTQGLSMPKTGRAKFPWLGNKTGTPRPPGSSKQHRALQVSDSSYPTVSWD